MATRVAGPVGALSGEQFTLRWGDHVAVIVEVGGGIRRYDVAGRAVLAGFGADELCPRAAGTVLVPWPNRLAGGRYAVDGHELHLPITEPARHSANHGLGRWSRWAVHDLGASHVELAWTVPPQSGYPFPLDVRTRWSLGADGLHAVHSAENLGTATAPFGLGVHPYVDIGGRDLAGVTVRSPARRYLAVDANLTPTGSSPTAGTDYDLSDGAPLGARRFDSCVTDLDRDGQGRALLEVFGADGAGARVWLGPAFGYAQIFTQELPGVPRSVAIEPMTCAPDAFNSGAGLIRLEPGQRWTGEWGIAPLSAR